MVMRLRGCAFVLGLTLAGTGWAQDSGRTDGPEGSEYGKGGYSSKRGSVSLQANLGAALANIPRQLPLYAGATISYWADDWFLLEAHGGYDVNLNRINALIGPRFRTAYFPVSLYAGLKAGAAIGTGASPYTTASPPGVRFVVSPNAGADMLLANHVLLGLGYSLDLAIGAAIAHRISLDIGVRF